MLQLNFANNGFELPGIVLQCFLLIFFIKVLGIQVNKMVYYKISLANVSIKYFI